MTATIDWELVEIAYRAGILSLREIGAQHNVSHVAISKRARSAGWTRDLTAKIRAKAEALVSRQAVTAAVTSAKAVTEREVIEANAAQIARVRGEHRTDIQRSKRIANRLLSVLETLEVAEAPSEELRKAKADADAAGKPFEPEGIATLKEHAHLLRNLAETQRVLVGLEREAYGLAQFVEAPSAAPAEVDPVAGAKAIAFVLARAGAAIQQRHEENRP